MFTDFVFLNLYRKNDFDINTTGAMCSILLKCMACAFNKCKAKMYPHIYIIKLYYFNYHHQSTCIYNFLLFIKASHPQHKTALLLLLCFCMQYFMHLFIYQFFGGKKPRRGGRTKQIVQVNWCIGAMLKCKSNKTILSKVVL